jgi:hypothetical protein
VSATEGNGQPGYDEGFDAGYAAVWQDVAYELDWPLVARVARHGNPDELAHLTGRAIAVGEAQTAPPNGGGR